MKIIAIYPLDDKKHGYFDIIPVGVFIEPFYAGDNIHHLVLNTDMDFRDRLKNHHDLIKRGRTDLKPIVFKTMQEAQQYANKVEFGEWMNNNGL